MIRVSQGRFAKLRGVSKKTVTVWKQRGHLVMHDDLVDVEASDRRLAERPEWYKGGKLGGTPKGGLTDNGDMADVIRVKETYNAMLHQLEYDRKAGLVIEVSTVTKLVADRYQTLRHRLINMGSQLAHLLAISNSPEECQAIIDAELAQALATLDADQVYREARRIALEEPIERASDDDQEALTTQ